MTTVGFILHNDGTMEYPKKQLKIKLEQGELCYYYKEKLSFKIGKEGFKRY